MRQAFQLIAEMGGFCFLCWYMLHWAGGTTR